MSQDKFAEDTGGGHSQSKSNSTRSKHKSLPWWSVAAASICAIAHFYSICSLFSYAGIMAADLSWAEDRDHAGNVAGFLQTANVIGRIPTSSLWGYFANRFGLKCGLAISMTSLALGNLLFGLCTGSVYLAVAVRFVFLGMCSGWVAMVGPLAIELGGQDQQTHVIGKIFAAGTFIQLIGPAVGGWTYGVVPSFPAVIPGSLGAALSLFALAAVWRCMPPSDKKTITEQSSNPSKVRAVDLVCKNRIPLLILLRSLQGFVNFAFFEVVPLWAISSIELGGLAMSEDSLGLVLATSGVGSGLFNAFVLSRITSRFGLRFPIVTASMVIAAGFVLVPLFPGLVTLTILHAIMNSAYGLMAAGYISSVNNMVFADERLTLNGISVTFESIGKGIAPVVGAVSFASSLSSWGRAGHLIVFSFMTSLHVLLAFGTFLLPCTMENPVDSDKTDGSLVVAATPSVPLPVTIGTDPSRRTSDDDDLEVLASKAKDHSEVGNVASRECGLEQDEEDALIDAEESTSGHANSGRSKIKTTEKKKMKRKEDSVELEPLKMKIDV